MPMLTLLPLFASTCDHVAWIDPGRFVFDREMKVVAFIANGNAFAESNLDWLGPVDGTPLCDRDGRPVAFNPERSPRGQSAGIVPPRPQRPAMPARPKHPLTPRRPLFPAEPQSGWSPLGFAAWAGIVTESAPANE